MKITRAGLGNRSLFLLASPHVLYLLAPTFFARPTDRLKSIRSLLGNANDLQYEFGFVVDECSELVHSIKSLCFREKIVFESLLPYEI